MDELKGLYRVWVSEGLGKQEKRERHPRWTESIAVGGEGSVREVKEKLGAKAMWREMVGADRSYELRESSSAHNDDFTPQNEGLRKENAFIWDISI